MAFSKATGIAGSIPQNFIDRSLPQCPLCGGDPNWYLDETKELKRYRALFQCQECNAVLSADLDEIDVYSYVPKKRGRLSKVFDIFILGGIRPTIPDNTMATVYFKVENLGKAPKNKLRMDREYNLEQLNELVNEG